MLDAGDITAYFADHAVLNYLSDMSGEPDKLRIAEQYLSIEPYALALPAPGQRLPPRSRPGAQPHLYIRRDRDCLCKRLRRADAA